MTKTAALQAFFEGFGIPTYPSSAVPAKAEMPYLTYEAKTASLGDGDQAITVNLWYWTETEAAPNAKAQEISEKIGRGGITITCDGGLIWIKRGSPFCQAIVDTSDTTIKRRYINISAEFLTAD